MYEALYKLSEKYRKGRENESKLSKEINGLDEQLKNKNMPYKDYIETQITFDNKSNELVELKQYNS